MYLRQLVLMVTLRKLVLMHMQVLGAAWYLLSIDRYTTCWKSYCRKELSLSRCIFDYLDCDSFNSNDRITWANSTKVFESCSPQNDIQFKYGIFENAVTKSVVSSNFIEKYFYCLWWGLQNLRYKLVSCVAKHTVRFH